MNYVRKAFAYEVKNDIVCILHEYGIIGYGKEFEYSQRGYHWTRIQLDRWNCYRESFRKFAL